MFYFERKKKALAALESAQRVYNIIGSSANYKAIELYGLRKRCSVAIKNVETYIALLSNSPQNYKKDVAETQIIIKEFNHAVALENDYNSGKVSASGVIAGSAIATLGPTAAMTFAWYGHLKLKQEFSWFASLPLIGVIAFSWAIAFFEYSCQIPANRIGFIGNGGPFSLMQLKVIQEVITLVVFTVFSTVFFKGEVLQWNHFAAFLCLIAAVYFVFMK